MIEISHTQTATVYQGSYEYSYGEKVYSIYCEPCNSQHPFDSRWTFNGDFEKPTFSPSMLIHKDDPARRCHSFVENGQIRYLEDSFHALKGQTVDLKDFD